MKKTFIFVILAVIFFAAGVHAGNFVTYNTAPVAAALPDKKNIPSAKIAPPPIPEAEFPFETETEENISEEKTEPEICEKLLAYIMGLCDARGLDFDIVIALIWRESDFISGAVSPGGDFGLMQINIVNHKWLSDELGVTDFLDAMQNCNAGTYMLADLLAKYGDISRALMAYNMGEGNAAKLWARGIFVTDYVREILNA